MLDRLPFCGCKVCFFFFFKQKTAYEMLRSLVGSEMCIRDSINGVAAVAYAANHGDDLKLALCSNAACTSATLSTVDSLGTVGLYPSIINLNNQPAITYIDESQLKLKFYYAGDESFY